MRRDIVEQYVIGTLNAMENDPRKLTPDEVVAAAFTMMVAACNCQGMSDQQVLDMCGHLLTAETK